MRNSAPQPAAQTAQASSTPAAVQAMPVQLQLPAVYVSSSNPADQINADKSFSLQEGGQPYHGTFTESGNSLELSISETNTATTLTLQGNSLTDASGHNWMLRK